MISIPQFCDLRPVSGRHIGGRLVVLCDDLCIASLLLRRTRRDLRFVLRDARFSCRQLVLHQVDVCTLDAGPGAEGGHGNSPPKAAKDG